MDNKLEKFKEEERIFSKARPLEVGGECQRCGKCCELAARLIYNTDGNGGLTFHHTHYPKKKYVCECYEVTNGLSTCVRHDWCKPHLCKKWPFFEEDLEVVNCPGFYPLWPKSQITSG